MTEGEIRSVSSRAATLAAARARLEATSTGSATGASATGPSTAPQSKNGSGRSGSALKTRVHRWSRLIHVYTAMFGLVAILFFAATGLLLNNPSWTLGTSGSVTTAEGVLPDGVVGTDSIDYLAADQYLRSEQDVRGDVTDYGETSGQASINYKNPGYSAYATFDAETGAYTLTVTQTGLVSTVNDLHTGTSVGGTWKFLINIVAVVLIVIAVSGLVIQFFLRKRRRSSFIVAGAAGVALVVTFIWVILG